LPTRLRGRLMLHPPMRIRVEPRQFNLDLNPGQTLDIPVDWQVPTNYPGGPATLLAELRIDGTNPTKLTLRTPLVVTANGLDVQVTATPIEGALRIIQRITNHTDRSLALRCVLVAPDRPRIGRTIPELPPGQTVTRTFLLDAPPKTAHTEPRAARISVEEIDG